MHPVIEQPYQIGLSHPTYCFPEQKSDILKFPDISKVDLIRYNGLMSD